jgi:hypothetical protein
VFQEFLNLLFRLEFWEGLILLKNSARVVQLPQKTADSLTAIHWLIVLSIFIHAVAIYVFGSLEFPGVVAIQQTKVLKITITQNPQAQESPKMVGRPDGAPIMSAPRKTIRVVSPARSRSYSNLFPKRSLEALGLPSGDSTPMAQTDQAHDNLMDKMTIGRRYGLTGKRATPELERRLDEFGTHIEIPLIWRNLSKESKAEAILRMDVPDGVVIESLYGEPLLRAAIFSGLLDRGTLKKLESDLRNQKLFRYRVILRYVPVNEPPSGLGLSIAAFSDGMVITKLLPQVMKQWAGTPVEDEESRRAKRREQAMISRLMDSAAFSHPIVEFRLGGS